MSNHLTGGPPATPPHVQYEYPLKHSEPLLMALMERHWEWPWSESRAESITRTDSVPCAMCVTLQDTHARTDPTSGTGTPYQALKVLPKASVRRRDPCGMWVRHTAHKPDIYSTRVAASLRETHSSEVIEWWRRGWRRGRWRGWWRGWCMLARVAQQSTS